MPKFRNVSGDTLSVQLPDGRFGVVADGEVVELDTTDRYVQTGEYGEPATWELIAPASTTKKTAQADTDKE